MPTASYSRRIYLRFVTFCFGTYFHVYHRLKIEGAENIPPHGPLFVLINHVSLLEPFALGIGVMSREIFPGIDIFTVAKKELFKAAPIAWFLSSIGMFPIDRERTDLAAMRTMLTYLKESKMIAMAPEGARSPTGQLQAFQPVVAKIAVSRHIPILPVGASGAECALPVGAKIPRAHPITVRFGPVFELSEFYNTNLTDERADQASWVMREHVAALLPEWMRELPPPSDRVGARKF
jgi:1-acyl-sn-glycerol-3-phosphate acyltransferase